MVFFLVLLILIFLNTVHWLLVNYMLLINQCTASILICFNLHEPSSFSLQHGSFPAELFPARQPPVCIRAMTLSQVHDLHFSLPTSQAHWSLSAIHQGPFAQQPTLQHTNFPLGPQCIWLTRTGLRVTLSSLAQIRMLNCSGLRLASQGCD